MRRDFWTKARIGTLKRLWTQGKTASAIAKELSRELGGELGGISRAAVLGKVFRLRLGAGESAPKPASQAKAGKPKAGSALPRDRPARRRGAEPQVTAPRVAKRKSLFDLTNECCRWPHGEPGAKSFFFCAAPGADVLNGLPYCPRHMRRAYIVPPPLHAAASTRTTPVATSVTTSVTPWRVISKAA